MTLPTFFFLMSALGVVYIVAGYPIVLYFLAQRSTQLVAKDTQARSVSVILPVLDGEKWVGDKLNSILSLDFPPELMEVIVVSDGSTDQTDEIVRHFNDPRVRFLRVPRGGKAQALTAGMNLARNEILFFTDVRQPLERTSLTHLVACFCDPRVGAVSGELVLLKGSKLSEENSGLYWRYEKWIRGKLSQIDSVPGATGCIYAMRRELAIPVPGHILADDVYLPISAFLKGYRIVFEESAKAFDQPMPLKTEYRRKVRTLAGVYQVIAAFPALLGPRNRMWFHFMSHKAGRLLLPWMLLANLVTSFYLPSGLRIVALGSYGVLFALALFDGAVPERLFIKRATSAAGMFVGLMAATLFAVSIFVLPNRYFWKVTTGSIQKIPVG
jgi:poly-beta-1,6-N-acetyl-D-glucosamine synthase